MIGERSGDRDPLLLAAGQLRRPVSLAAAEAHGLQQLVRATIPLRACDAGKHHRQRHVLRGAHGGHEVERLKNNSHVDKRRDK